MYAPDIQIGVLSCPRGAAKTWIAGQLAALALRPGSPTFDRGVEVLGVSASLEQSRVLLNFVREAPGGRGRRVSLARTPEVILCGQVRPGDVEGRGGWPVGRSCRG